MSLELYREHNLPPEEKISEVKTILIASYRHSQGDAGNLHWMLFYYIHKAIPSLVLSAQETGQVIQEAEQKINKMFHIGTSDDTSDQQGTGHYPISREKVRTSLHEDVWKLQAILREKGGPGADHFYHLDSGQLLSRILTRIIEREHEFFSRGGRENRHHSTSQETRDWASDPYFSFLIEYGLRKHGRKTEHPIFDDLYKKLGNLVELILRTKNESGLIWPDHFTQLKYIIEQYNLHHPASPFMIED
jgi:hypothetical protein